MLAAFEILPRRESIVVLAFLKWLRYSLGQYCNNKTFLEELYSWLTVNYIGLPVLWRSAELSLLAITWNSGMPLLSGVTSLIELRHKGAVRGFFAFGRHSFLLG